MSHTLSISMRPQHLSEFVGSPAVVTAIQKQITSDRVPTGWLFHGPSGTGKTTLALIVARLVQGVDYPADQDIECEEENAADNGKVADARRFAEDAAYNPRQGKYRVLIMDEMQQATTEAQNVFLKLLENPLGKTIYIFCTTDPSKIIPALRGRCLQYRLQPLNDKELMTLVVRGWKALKIPEDRTEASKFISALTSKEVRAPRDILMSLERLASGMSVNQSVHTDDDKPEYADIARAIIHGTWPIARGLLKQVRATEGPGLRSVVSSFLKNELLDGAQSEYVDDALCTGLISLGRISSYEGSVNFGATVGLLYDVCKTIKGED